MFGKRERWTIFLETQELEVGVGYTHDDSMHGCSQLTFQCRFLPALFNYKKSKEYNRKKKGAIVVSVFCGIGNRCPQPIT